MKRIILAAATMALTISTSQAGGVHFSIGIGLPLPAPVAVAPAPVYVPAPVYMPAPPLPVYAAPVVVAPPPVYARPVVVAPAPVYMRPPGIYLGFGVPGYRGHGHYPHHHGRWGYRGCR